VTTKSQTTLPSGVRKALGVMPGDELEYVIEGDHAVVRKVAGVEEADPVLAAFLDLLGSDMAKHPERVQGMPRDLLARIQSLVAGVPVNHDERIVGAVAL
jgi:antitoxin PrlF